MSLDLDDDLQIDWKIFYKDFKANKVKNSNLIIDLLIKLEESDDKNLQKIYPLIFKIFSELIKSGELKNFDRETRTPKETFSKWLFERYNDVCKQFLKIITGTKHSNKLKENITVAMVKLLQAEALHPTSTENLSNIQFPVSKLKNFYEGILVSEQNLQFILTRLKNYLECPDFLFISLHVLSEIIPNLTQNKSNENQDDNLMTILELINLPIEGKKALKAQNLFISAKNDENGHLEQTQFQFPHEKAKEYINIIWDSVLKRNFSLKMYRRSLRLIPDKVLMHLDQPVRLADFFINAFDHGGAVSLLAMHGVFILITEYNLEYPDFYDKLYAMFTPDIFNVRYKAKFFTLCNKFFDSPYLPEYIVAAFVKRCSRLMLTAPSYSLILLLRFVVNLLLRFPSLQKLIHDPDAKEAIEDPFLADEPTPKLCRAVDSSLWEIFTLRHHPLCGISKAANFIDRRNLPDIQIELKKHLSTTYEDLYENASKIKQPKIATTFYKPDGLFKYPDDSMSDMWDIK